MSEKEMRVLMNYSKQCEKISTAKVYESDKEVADSIKKIPVRRVNGSKQHTCVFALKNA